MDPSQSFEESKIMEKYSGLDESLRFVQSLVSNSKQKGEEEPLQESFDSQQFQQTSQNYDQDMQPEANEANEQIMEDVEEPENSDLSIHSILHSEDDKLNVEARLYKINDVYRQRREAKLQAVKAEEEQKKKSSKPMINKKSLKMTKGREEQRIPVEERLLNYAKKKKALEPDEKSHPDVSQASQQKKKKAVNYEVVTRLHDYGRLYKVKQAEKEAQFKKSQTFKPNIEKSNTLAHIQSKYKNSSKQPVQRNDDNELLKYTTDNSEEVKHSFSMQVESHPEDRLYSPMPIKAPSKKILKIQDEYDRNHPFHPKIDALSRAIVQHKREIIPEEDQFQKRNKGFEEYNFTPNLDKNSEEIIRL